MTMNDDSGKLLFCATFLVLGIVAVVLCFASGAWFPGLIMLALSARMALGVVHSAKPSADAGMWLTEQHHHHRRSFG